MRLLIVGDSSAAGVGVTDQKDALSGQLTTRLAASYRVGWTLMARTGDRTGDALRALEKAPAAPFDATVLALGVNDATRFISIRRWRREQTALRTLLRNKFGVRKIIVTGMPPMGQFPALTPLLKWFLGPQAKRMEQALCEDLRSESDTTLVTFDMPMQPHLMASDGFHPSADTYALWAQAVAEHFGTS